MTMFKNEPVDVKLVFGDHKDVQNLNFRYRLTLKESAVPEHLLLVKLKSEINQFVIAPRHN